MRIKHVKRCTWCGEDPLYQAYHDTEWGVPVHDDHKLFEFLILEGAQAGLSWTTILKKRQNYRKAFDGFRPEKIARYGKRDVQRLLRDEGIVRNRLKITATIENAKMFLAVRKEFGTFDAYLWSFVGGKPIQNNWRTVAEVPARTAEGTTSRYAFELPYDTLPPATRLVITTTAKVFERSVTLRAAGDDRRGREPYALANETWRNSQPDLAAPPLEFELASNDSRHVELVVNEGDNAPLPVATATLQLPSIALRFYNSGSALTLLYGNSRATAPQYDLALLAPRVLGEAARDLQLAEPAPAAPVEGSSLDVKIFWIALAVVTLLLLAVLARLIGSRASATNP